MLEKYGVKTGVMPIGDWRYMQPLADGSLQRIPPSGCAGTDGDLVAQVKNFRANNAIDLGDVEGDIAEFIRRESPINDRFPGKPAKRFGVQAEGQPGFRPYIERIRDWLLVIGAKQPKLLISDEADARAAVCMNCPQNVPWKTGCLPCCDAVVSRGQNVRQLAAYQFDKKLGACRLHDFHVSTAIFIDRDFLPPVNPDAPAPCWMRKVA